MLTRNEDAYLLFIYNIKRKKFIISFLEHGFGNDGNQTQGIVDARQELHLVQHFSFC